MTPRIVETKATHCLQARCFGIGWVDVAYGPLDEMEGREVDLCADSDAWMDGVASEDMTRIVPIDKSRAGRHLVFGNDLAIKRLVELAELAHDRIVKLEAENHELTQVLGDTIATQKVEREP